jgi:hypothetical protein
MFTGRCTLLDSSSLTRLPSNAKKKKRKKKTSAKAKRPRGSNRQRGALVGAALAEKTITKDSNGKEANPSRHN